jgi:hypothetical protein
MNPKIKFLEIILSDLISERDTLEMDLNYILNSDKKTKEKKVEFIDILGPIVDTNNKIKTLSEYISILTTPPEVDKDKIQNNNN